MARKPNHAYEKRQRELDKKARRDEKRERKRAARDADKDGTPAADGVAGDVASENPEQP